MSKYNIRNHKKSNKKKSQVDRREYFKAYNRKHKHRLKMVALYGGSDKLDEAIYEKEKPQITDHFKLELKSNNIKNFLNIK